MNTPLMHPASYKDPAGFLFSHNGTLYRHVSQKYSAIYQKLMSSGLYNQLVQQNWLIPHTEVNENFTGNNNWYLTLQPQPVPVISYAYEWSFSQLKDAALLTLNIHELALQYGLCLKDATPFNIQFVNGKPVLIDTLSFEEYQPKLPWKAYRQFCQMQLFPLFLEKNLQSGIQKILAVYLDGLTPTLTWKLLPSKAKFRLSSLLHIYLQRKVLAKYKLDEKPGNFNLEKMQNLIRHLKDIINAFPDQQQRTTTWNNYYAESILGDGYLQQKEKIFRSFINGEQFQQALDLGANDGHFSFILRDYCKEVIAVDADFSCINNLYQNIKQSGYTTILPLAIDIVQPTASIGWANKERAGFEERINPQLTIALALVHHLVFSCNVPLEKIAAYLASFSPVLIVEYVSNRDEKVIAMRKDRADGFHVYSETDFENAFTSYFSIVKKETITGTFRILYKMVRKTAN